MCCFLPKLLAQRSASADWDLRGRCWPKASESPLKQGKLLLDRFPTPFLLCFSSLFCLRGRLFGKRYSSSRWIKQWGQK